MIDTSAVYIIEVMFVATVILVALLAALITIGLERQKKELAGIRKEIEGWVVEDLGLKRTKMATDLKIPDPLAWLRQIASRATGTTARLTQIVPNGLGDPKFIQAIDDQGRKYMFSATTPDGLNSYRASRPWFGARARLSQMVANHPLIPLPRGSEEFELSVLNCGYMFDLEAAKVWEQQTGEKLLMSELWLYVLPAAEKK